jgi:hypothetical protein
MKFANFFLIALTLFSQKTDGLMEFLEIDNVNVVRPFFEQLSISLRLIPPIIMLATTSKLFIFTLVNILVAIAITKSSWSATKDHSKNNNLSHTMASVNQAFEDLENESLPHEQVNEHHTSIQEMPSNPKTKVVTPEKRYDDTARQSEFDYSNHIYARSTKQKQINNNNDDIVFKLARPHFENSKNSLRSSFEARTNNLQNEKVNTDEHPKYVEIPENHHQPNLKLRGLAYHEDSNNMLKQANDRPSVPPKPINKYILQSTGHEDSVNFRSASPMNNENNAQRLSRNLREIPKELQNQFPFKIFPSPNEGHSDNSFENNRHAGKNDELNFISIPEPDYNDSPIMKNRRSQNNFNKNTWQNINY